MKNYLLILLILILNNEYYDINTKIYQFCDIAIIKKKIKLMKENEKMIINLFI